jgi:hypothetical protein
MSNNPTLVHRRKIKWNLANSTEFLLQYIKQYDSIVLFEEWAAILFAFFDESFMHKTAG